jgi:hypothetical protein
LTANFAAIKEIPSNFKEPEVSSPCSQEPSTGPYLSQIDPVHSIPSYVSKTILKMAGELLSKKLEAYRSTRQYTPEDTVSQY